MSQGDEPEQVQTTKLDFGQALQALRRGQMVQREGWNGKGMFLFIRPAYSCGRADFMRLVSVPDNVKVKITEGPRPEGPELYRFRAYVSLYAADGSIVNGWVPSQVDMLAWDWRVVS